MKIEQGFAISNTYGCSAVATVEPSERTQLEMERDRQITKKKKLAKRKTEPFGNGPRRTGNSVFVLLWACRCVKAR